MRKLMKRNKFFGKHDFLKYSFPNWRSFPFRGIAKGSFIFQKIPIRPISKFEELAFTYFMP